MLTSDQTVDSDIIRFFRGECGNNAGDTLEDILYWDDVRLEREHSFVQWLFPSNEPSMFNVDAPVLSREDEKAFRESKELQRKQHWCFCRMMQFFGYEVLDFGDKDYVELVVIEPSKGNRYPQHALEGFNHNMLRITRILKSLRLTGNDRCFHALWEALQHIRPQISLITWGHWERAANESLWSDLANKRNPGDLETIMDKYSMEKTNEELKPAINNLTTQDVVKTGTDVGKDVLKQAAVWVLAGALADTVRRVLGSFVKKT